MYEKLFIKQAKITVILYLQIFRKFVRNLTFHHLHEHVFKQKE